MSEKLTADDRNKLPQERRTELIDGTLFDMASPKIVHQIIVGEMYRQLADAVSNCGKNCLVVLSPSDVYLDDDVFTVVQPDLYIVCAKKPFREDGYLHGAPAWIAEVLSPSTRSKDLFLKSWKYKNAGVKEYWIVDPDTEKVIVYEFSPDSSEEIVQTVYGFTDTIPLRISGGACSINFEKIRHAVSRAG